MQVKLQEVIKGLAIVDRRGSLGAEITGISSDSRKVEPGHMFVAIRGQEHDGHAHIGEAIARGAGAVVAERWNEADDRPKTTVDVVLVSDARRALGVVAANLYGRPTRRLQVAGVTGTNGKTTVTYLLESIIRSTGRKVGVIGTVGVRYGDKHRCTNNTTPGALELQQTLALMLESGVSHAILEVSSHALHQERCHGVDFKVAGFTNFSQDHLDYHGSIEAYFEAKSQLFSDLLSKSRARGRSAVINMDDPRGEELSALWKGRSFGVSSERNSDVDVSIIQAKFGLDGIEATLQTKKGVCQIRSTLVGEYNLSNILVAVGMALAMGFSTKRIAGGINALERVPGRLERVPDGNQRVVFVDYAHTPDAIEKVLDAIRPHVTGRVAFVFGAGGQRDSDKRESMGKSVGSRAELVWVTNDNPRRESPRAIAEQLVEGLIQGGLKRCEGEQPSVGEFVIELDRIKAIYQAVAMLEPGDALVVAGKGHETTQVVGDQTYSLDDRIVVRRALDGHPMADLQLSDDAAVASEDSPEPIKEKILVNERTRDEESNSS
ncbi:MAG: UDP-N-acetylmuramoyl-L-alanyl-D-glutamate--2,6-diaminopimelate ligase [Myxococcales bacterium]|nr:UDP-N-acetylmuramoyl-L-alanyl-D-glutamate--2,6-diaminopimelate ligase [Myxococcales bacterium]